MDRPYIHGFSSAEQHRLSRMQEILNDAELALLDLSGVRSLLDVGAGLAQMTRLLARRLDPGARVVAIERDARQRAEALRRAEAAGESELFDLRAGDAERLPLSDAERGSFDLAHARFLLEHVPDPLAVVRELVSAVRPGGRIVLLDDDHDLLRLWPTCTRAERAWRAYWESYRDLGCDPLVGRRLAALLHEAGACTTRVTTVFYGAFSGGELFDPVVDNLIGVLESAAGSLDATGRFTRSEMKVAIEELSSWRRQGAATVWYSLPLAEGVRP